MYRGEQDETVYRRLDDGSDPAHAQLEIAKQQALKPGDFYPLHPADRRHPLRQNDLEKRVDLHPSSRERHRVHLAAQVRPERGHGDAVPFGLRERAVSSGSTGRVGETNR